MTHPDEILFESGSLLPVIPVCEHFAGNEKFIRKGVSIQSSKNLKFDITCDCEDGAPIGGEKQHAVMIATLLKELSSEQNRLGVRIHDPLHASCREDIEILLTESGPNIAYLTIPKPSGYDDAAATVDYIQDVAERLGCACPPIHILIETQSALEEVAKIATINNLQGLIFGLLDFISDHQGAISASAMRSPGQFSNQLIKRAKTEIAAAALRNGLIATHNPCLEINDPSVAHEDAKIARLEYGYMRMYCIHPAQIEPIVTAMQPSGTEISKAADILIAAQKVDWGPISHKNEMHDRASYRYFWNLLKQADFTGVTLDDQTKDLFFNTKEKK